MKSFLLLVYVAILIYTINYSSACCEPHPKQPFRCCGKGKCNIFCCNCNGGCKPRCGRLISRDVERLAMSAGDIDIMGHFRGFGGINANDYARRNISYDFFKSVDNNKDGKIDLNEAITYLFPNKIEHHNALQNATLWFGPMDKDNNGFIEPKEFDYSLI